jgi:hypothetical protein
MAEPFLTLPFQFILLMPISAIQSDLNSALKAHFS